MLHIVYFISFQKENWSLKMAEDWIIQNGFQTKILKESRNTYRFYQCTDIFKDYITIGIEEMYPGIMVCFGRMYNNL